RGEVPAAQRRLELDRADEMMARRAVRVPRERSDAGFVERLRGLLLQLGGSRAVQLRKQCRRTLQVERADLEQLLAGALFQPFGEACVMLGAGRLREAGVGDLADQHMLELVGP